MRLPNESDDFTVEPIRGLPAVLPKGERILWQGTPRWRSSFKRATSTRLVLLWFGGLIAWNAAEWLTGRETLSEAGGTMLVLGVLCTLALGLIGVMIWMSSNATVYTLTNRRIVIRHGLAVDFSINLPFTQIGNLDLRRYADGTGDLPLGLTGEHSLSIFYIWPNSRPWRFSRPEPMLRAVPDAERVGAMIADALRDDLARRGEAALPGDASRPAPAASQEGRGGLAAGTLHPAE